MSQAPEVHLKGYARLRRVEFSLFRAGDEGTSLADMAKDCGVNRSTIFRDIRKLEEDDVPIWVNKGKYGIDRTRYLPAVRFNLHEATALFVAAPSGMHGVAYGRSGLSEGSGVFSGSFAAAVTEVWARTKGQADKRSQGSHQGGRRPVAV